MTMNSVPEVVGKELRDNRYGLHKSRESLEVLDVVFQDVEIDGFKRCEVYAVTSRGNETIGAIYSDGIQAIASRDMVMDDESRWGRILLSVAVDETVEEAKRAFTAHWKGTHVFVRPGMPPVPGEGEMFLYGGESVLVQAWLDQSLIWMQLALDNSGVSQDVLRLNIAYSMAGHALELVFKSLAWAKEMGDTIRPIHSVRHFYQQLDTPTQKEIGALVENAGWDSMGSFLSYIDDFLRPVHRRYFGISPQKEFLGLNITKNHRLVALSRVHKELCKIAFRLLKPPTFPPHDS